MNPIRAIEPEPDRVFQADDVTLELELSAEDILVLALAEDFEKSEPLEGEADGRVRRVL